MSTMRTAVLLSLFFSTIPFIMGKNTLLHVLYNNRIGIALRRHVVTKPLFSKLTGRLANTRISRLLIEPFIKKYDIDMKEAVRTDPNEYDSFNDFFTRKLKSNARPINQNKKAVISPADGILHAFENVGPQTELFIKNTTFDIKKFLKSEQLAEKFRGGTIIVVYLAPHNYHRFHFPCDGIPHEIKKIDGIYESVQPIAYNTNIQPLTENERHVTLIETNDCGTVALVSVGALCIGRITETYKPGQSYTKGSEAGYFSFGGSTIVLCFEKNRIDLDPAIKSKYVDGSNRKITVHMGQQIGTKRTQ